MEGTVPDMTSQSLERMPDARRLNNWNRADLERELQESFPNFYQSPFLPDSNKALHGMHFENDQSFVAEVQHAIGNFASEENKYNISFPPKTGDPKLTFVSSNTNPETNTLEHMFKGGEDL